MKFLLKLRQNRREIQSFCLLMGWLMGLAKIVGPKDLLGGAIVVILRPELNVALTFYIACITV